MIPLRCGHCGKELKVKEELAGKKVKCPGCQKAVPVPQPAASLSPPPSGRAEGVSQEEARTLPPKSEVGSQKSEVRSQRDSLSEVEGQMNLGGRTQALPEEGPSAEFTEFLAPAEQPDEIGRLGPYRVLQVLGAGGLGVVFKAEDPRLGRLVALKAMLPALASSGSAKERFFREARAAAALKHPNIVTIYQVGEDRGVPFLAMEFLEGESLEAMLKRDKVPAISEILHIARQIARGLAVAHDKGLVHRDIKPANIWLETGGVVSGGVVSGKHSSSGDNSPLTNHQQ